VQEGKSARCWSTRDYYLRLIISTLTEIVVLTKTHYVLHSWHWIYTEWTISIAPPPISKTTNQNWMKFWIENRDYDGFVQILTRSLISILWFSPKTASNFWKIKFQIFTLNVNILASNNKCHTLTLTFLQNIDILAHNNNCHILSLTFLHSDRPQNILPCNSPTIGARAKVEVSAGSLWPHQPLEHLTLVLPPFLTELFSWTGLKILLLH